MTRELEQAEAFGELVWQKRERYGLSLREVGRLTGLSFSTVSRVEHGLGANFRNFMALADWLELNGPARESGANV